MQALANDPPVPLMAEMAILAVSLSASADVELPVMKADAVSVNDGVESCHLGSNQSAWKSNSEKMSTRRRIEQYAQGYTFR